MSEQNKVVGRPFDPDAARAAQKKAVETRLQNKVERENADKNPNGAILAAINANCEKVVHLLDKLVKADEKRHPQNVDIHRTVGR